jgi:hypothetical protein
MPSISSSKYQTLRTCPRLFYWEYVRFIERVKQDGARAFGTLYHLGLEAWWRVAGQGDVPWADLDQPLVDALKAIDTGAKHVETDPYEHAKARAMMVAYHARYAELEFERASDADGGVETFFRVPLLDPDDHPVDGWTVIGKKDALVKLATRTRWTPIEHKTTASDISSVSDYVARLAVDGQISNYVDAATRLGFESNEVLYDMSRKPDLSPERETPEEKREKTQGKGCKECGGSAGGKNGIKKGSGVVMVEDKSWIDADIPGPLPHAPKVEAPCPECNGTGWKEEPRWKANVRLADEPPIEYGMRVANKIAENPEAYLRQAFVPRSPEQIAEARADLVAATVEIDALYARMRRTVDRVEDPRARLVFPRNTSTCLNLYGRRCDFLDVCSGAIKEPTETTLYQIKKKPTPEGK